MICKDHQILIDKVERYQGNQTVKSRHSVNAVHKVKSIEYPDCNHYRYRYEPSG